MADALRGPANIDCDELIAGMAYALHAHIHIGSHAAANAATSCIPVFDESAWRLTGDDPFWSRLGNGAAPRNLVHYLKEFIRKVSAAMDMRDDPEVLVMAFVYIERLINAVGSIVRPTTLRPLILVAVGIACKSWFDETTYCRDLCDNVCGDRLNMYRLLRAEDIFVGAIRFRAVVSRKVFVKYYFALTDIVTHLSRRSAPAQMSRRRRDSAPHDLTYARGALPVATGCFALRLANGRRLSGDMTHRRARATNPGKAS
jgi:hypothetical protein